MRRLSFFEKLLQLAHVGPDAGTFLWIQGEFFKFVLIEQRRAAIGPDPEIQSEVGPGDRRFSDARGMAEVAVPAFPLTRIAIIYLVDVVAAVVIVCLDE